MGIANLSKNKIKERDKKPDRGMSGRGGIRPNTPYARAIPKDLNHQQTHHPATGAI